MNVLRKFRRLLAYLFSGFDIFGFDERIIHIVPKIKRGEAWFSYPSILRSIIKEYKVDLVLDVGANKGQFALEVRKFYKGPIFSFEPVLDTFTRLKNTAARDKDWYLFNYALGSESKDQNINVYKDDRMSSFLETNEYFVERSGVKDARAVKELSHLRRLDDILGEFPFDIHSKKILLKMDTQGYDLEVFKGASNINKNLVALQSEVSPTPIYQGMPPWTDTLHEYEKAGFKLAGLFPLIRDGMEFLECDCLMVKVPSNPRATWVSSPKI
jgi:FkbM family methyltransferase